MTSKTIHTFLVACLVLTLVALFGGTFAINKMLSQKSGTLVNHKAQSQALEQEQEGLRAAKKDIAKYAELEKIAKAIVPEDKNEAEAVRQIVKIAGENNIKLGSITFPASTLGGSGTAPNATGSSSSSSGSSTTGNSKSTTLSQLQPVKSIPGVYQLPITISNDSKQPVQYTKFISFLDGLEHNRRTSQVSSIVLEPDNKNRNLLNFTITINQYIKPVKKS